MITPENFTLSIGVLKWSWLRPGETGNLCIEVLNWQNPAEVLETVPVTDKTYREYYMHQGFTPRVNPGHPVIIRVTEQVNGSSPCSFVHTIPDQNKTPIKWSIRKGSPIWEISVTYPDVTKIKPEIYPENMLHLLVRNSSEPRERGARFYLPRPNGVKTQSFWFDPQDGYSVELRLDQNLLLLQSDLLGKPLTVGDVFTLRRV